MWYPAQYATTIHNPLTNRKFQCLRSVLAKGNPQDLGIKFSYLLKQVTRQVTLQERIFSKEGDPLYGFPSLKVG